MLKFLPEVDRAYMQTLCKDCVKPPVPEKKTRTVKCVTLQGVPSAEKQKTAKLPRNKTQPNPPATKKRKTTKSNELARNGKNKRMK